MKKDWAVKAAFGLVVVAIIAYMAIDRGGGGDTFPVQDRKPISEFRLPDLRGNEWRITDHRGKVVLLNFWATWCQPCRSETPGLVDLAHRYANRGLEVAGVVMDEDRDAPVGQFVNEFHVGYPILRPPEGSTLFNAIQVLPTTLLIDKAGRVAKKYDGAVREAQFRRDVEKLLGEPTPAPAR